MSKNISKNQIKFINKINIKKPTKKTFIIK